jgi:hypothetical protein
MSALDDGYQSTQKNRDNRIKQWEKSGGRIALKFF